MRYIRYCEEQNFFYFHLSHSHDDGNRIIDEDLHVILENHVPACKCAYEARSINVAAAIRLDVIIISTHEQVARTVTFEPMARGTDLQVRPHLFATLHADAPVDRCIEYT